MTWLLPASPNATPRPESAGSYTDSACSAWLSATLAGFAADRLIGAGIREGAQVSLPLPDGSTEIIGALSPSQDVALFFAIFSLSGLGLVTANYWALTQTLLPGAAVGRLVGVEFRRQRRESSPQSHRLSPQMDRQLRRPMWAICIFLMAALPRTYSWCAKIRAERIMSFMDKKLLLENVRARVSEVTYSLKPRGRYIRPTDRIIVFLDDCGTNAPTRRPARKTRKRKPAKTIWHDRSEDAPG
jgi:hypothetical protein